MKARKTTPTYSVISLRELRRLLELAETDATLRYGADHPDRLNASAIIRGRSVRYDGKVQFHPETVFDQPLFVTEA